MEKNLLNKYLLINVFFMAFPFFLILGNLAVNLNIIFFIIISLIFFNKEILNLKLNFLDKIIVIFFFYTFISLFINIFEQAIFKKVFIEKIIFTKTFAYIRYLILYLVIRSLIDSKILNLKWFFYSCAFFSLIVSLDIYFQFFYGKNILGYIPTSSRHLSGFFNEELIAGGYLQKISLFIFFVPIVLKLKFRIRIICQIILFLFFTFAIILSGNRMPLILFIFSFFIYFLFNKEIKKLFFIFVFLNLVFVVFSISINNIIMINMKNFYNSSLVIFESVISSKKISELPAEILKTPYVKEFKCGIEIGKKNIFFGGGVRSYRTNPEFCNSHPHNYYLEIFSDLGLIGIFIISIFVISLTNAIFFKKFKFLNENKYYTNNYTYPFLLIFITEFFPLRSSGSFFSTNNASIIFIMLSCLISILLSSKKLKY